jgi:hypothetical protein
MKTLILVASAFSILLFSTSCEKSTDKPSYPIVGLWIGTYDVIEGSEPATSLYYSYDLRSDSSILMQGLGADGNTYYGTGTWSLTDTAFSANISTTNLSQEGVVQHVNAVYHKKNGTLSSGHVETVDGPFRASFTLSRIN